MKDIVRKSVTAPSMPASSSLASMHPSYRIAAIQASAALHNLTLQFRLKLKNARCQVKTGRA